MKDPPTLADALLGETFKPYYRQSDPEGWMRTHLLQARKFVLDKSMSAFMADLAYASLPAVRNAKRDQEVLDGMRTLARLPHKVTWIEFDMTARIKRANEAYGVTLKSEDSPTKGGWLFVQHPEIETAFLAVECLSHTVPTKFGDTDFGEPLIPTPAGHFINWVWTTDDTPLPDWIHSSTSWSKALLKDVAGRPVESYLTGIETYRSKSIGVIAAPFMLYSGIWDAVEKGPHIVASWLKNSASDMRYAWSLLAAINDTPVTAEVVRPAKGYVARGRYRKFLDHTVIKLTIPGKIDLRTLARRVSRLSRRRAHEVRGHWRRDYHNPGERLWIKEHQRGDASLGFVTHSYDVTHEQQ